jgi:hypothetical protein
MRRAAEGFFVLRRSFQGIVEYYIKQRFYRVEGGALTLTPKVAERMVIYWELIGQGTSFHFTKKCLIDEVDS